MYENLHSSDRLMILLVFLIEKLKPIQPYVVMTQRKLLLKITTKPKVPGKESNEMAIYPTVL